MFSELCRGRKENFEPCPYMEDCKLMKIPTFNGIIVGLTVDAFDYCLRDEEPPASETTIETITELYNATKDEKKWEFTLDEAIERYREHGLLKE